MPAPDRDPLDQRILRHADEADGHDGDRQPVAGGDAIDLVLHRAGVGVDVDADGRRRLWHGPDFCSALTLSGVPGQDGFRGKEHFRHWHV